MASSFVLRRLIIDTDAGVDDAMALVMALRTATDNVQTSVEAIIATTGNATADHVAVNVSRTLQVMNKVRPNIILFQRGLFKK